jgi:5-methylcytosine-specific restriction endonuclease McrA
MKTKHIARSSKPLAEAKGCVPATSKGEQACIDQTQPTRATLGRERNNTPADDLYSPLLCKPEANPRRGNAAGPDRHSCGTLIPNIVEENITPKSESSTAEQGSNPSFNRVLVINQDFTPAMPCHPARARQLLKAGKAAVYRQQPFIIALKYNTPGKQPLQLKDDPGAEQTGIAIVIDAKRGKRVIIAIELRQRDSEIVEALMQRHAQRRSRRQRKTRYRQARFDNRTKPEGWFAPSIINRVQKTATWISRLCKWAPITSITIEHVKFDTQKLDNPDITGIEYQQGTLLAYEIREYLLEKWGRRCADCEKADLPLQVEHMQPRSRKGSNRLINLTLACEPCNRRKGTLTAAEFGFPNLQPKHNGLAAAAAVNATRWALVEMAKATGLPLELGSGALTKCNRIAQGYPKAHWIDAAVAGASGDHVFLNPRHQPVVITACPRNSRRMVQPDKFGFPASKPKQCSQVHGFHTGDLARAQVASGKNKGTWIGRVAIRATGTFRVGKRDGINHKNLTKLQSNDGFQYQTFNLLARASLPGLKTEAS